MSDSARSELLSLLDFVLYRLELWRKHHPRTFPWLYRWLWYHVQYTRNRLSR